MIGKIENNQTGVIRVAIPRPIYKLLDYSCDQSRMPSPGCRVSVSLGNARITAIVVETNVATDIKALKPILHVLDEKTLLDDAMLSLLIWASRYYAYPLGEVIFHALPSLLRKGKPTPLWTIWFPAERAYSLSSDELKRAPRQQAMLDYFKDNCNSTGREGITETEIKENFGASWRNILRQLETKNLIKPHQSETGFYRPASSGKYPAKNPIDLTEEQQSCIEQIHTNFAQEKPKPILLHGITGSGKTEVYLRSITPLVEAGKQALVLVPEIGLTPQLLQRFEEHFPDKVIIALHSGMTDNERLRGWMGARSGEVDIVIGTRSAVFTPMINLGVILIDEEHDASFKQQEGFLFHARDMAIKRAFDAHIPVLMGSATPALESLHNVDKGRYLYLRLASRPGTRNKPHMMIQDIRSLPLEAGISPLLIKEIRQHIENKNQVMLFLNRRGFAPVLMCPGCGWHAICQHCDLGMTYHASVRKVICHHCGEQQPVKSRCPECNSDKITTIGQGTERIEQVLNGYFPDTPVVRIDRDSTSRKGALEDKLQQVHSGEPVILVGTQMLTKGHDFANLTLVGILDVDQALFSMDYRAQERLAQQIMQVAGRAGRGETAGRVVLQTSQPQHPLLINLLSQGYLFTAKQILNERERWNYPPHGSQVLIRVSAESYEKAMAFAEKLCDSLKNNEQKSLSLFGPLPSPLAKKANRYRFQILLGANHRKVLHWVIEQNLEKWIGFRKTGGVRWSIDVDPQDFL